MTQLNLFNETAPQDLYHSNVMGGSTCERRMECPGSAALEAAAPPEKPSRFAEEGSFLHLVMEHILQHDRKPEEMIGFTDNGYTLTRELVDEMILPALKCFDELHAEFGEFEYYTEIQVAYLGTDAFGTADVIGCNDKYSFIIDWKFGRGVRVIGSDDNKQLLFLAGAARETPETEDMFSPDRQIVLAIVQPAFAKTSGGLTHGVIGSNTLSNFVGDVHTTIKKINANCTDLNTGRHCRWCRAKDTCPAQLEDAEKLLAVDPQDPSIGPSDLGFLVGKAADMEVWIKSIMCRARGELEAGKPVDGYKLVAKRSTRNWISETRAEQQLRGAKFKVSDIMETKLLSPAKAEKLIKSKGSTCDLDGLIVSKSAGTTMVGIDDSRPAVSTRDGSNLGLPHSETETETETETKRN